jgi:hypothetical protein
MAEPGVISEFVERIARELEFDASLSRCVRQEVEDHLWEAVSADPTGDRLEAERRAVAKFGDPQAIAAQFVVVSLAKRGRRVGIGAIGVIAAVFLAMKARLTWYAAMAYSTGSMGALGATVLTIDRYAFWLSILVGIGSWMYIESRRIPGALTPEYRTQLRRFLLLCWVAAGALGASVISDGILTSFRLTGGHWSFEVLVPLLSMAIEVACAGGLVASIRGMTQRTASAGRLAAMPRV